MKRLIIISVIAILLLVGVVLIIRKKKATSQGSAGSAAAAALSTAQQEKMISDKMAAIRGATQDPERSWYAERLRKAEEDISRKITELTPQYAVNIGALPGAIGAYRSERMAQLTSEIRTYAIDLLRKEGKVITIS